LMVLLNMPCGVTYCPVCSTLCLTTFLYFRRDTSETETVHAEIIKIYSETRHRTKRVARNRYTRGEPYKVYFMDVRLPDGQKHKRSISLKSYNQYAYSSHRHRERPDSVNLLLTKGALGMTIIERDPDK
jgi:hypothetical protein